jgi:AcrR family transcriptional regulator
MSDMRTQLLKAAAQLFAERGYDAVSMRDIAKVVGVTQANLYYHFQDKADLIQSTLARVFETRAEHLSAWLTDHPEDQLGAFVRWLVGELMADPVFAGLFYRELLAADADRLGALSRTVLQAPFRSVVDAIDGAPLAGPAEATALSLVGFIVGQVLVLPLGPGLTGQDLSAETPDAVAVRVLTLLLPALRA